MYNGFGINLPAKYNVHGIDVSHYQQNINWDLVKEMKDDGVTLDFAYIKATEGVFTVDAMFRRNWVKAKDAGLARGAYHFFLPNRNASEQAKNFTAILKL